MVSFSTLDFFVFIRRRENIQPAFAGQPFTPSHSYWLGLGVIVLRFRELHRKYIPIGVTQSVDH
jgi:hypothetical protein